MKTRRYINDPYARDFFERLDNMAWWEGLICAFIGAVALFVMLIARCFGWRPKEDE